jgi:hypothetical protein
VRTVRNTQIQSVPHRRHITSPLQSPTVQQKLCGQNEFFNATVSGTYAYHYLSKLSPVHIYSIMEPPTNSCSVCGVYTAVVEHLGRCSTEGDVMVMARVRPKELSCGQVLSAVMALAAGWMTRQPSCPHGFHTGCGTYPADTVGSSLRCVEHSFMLCP